MKIMAIDYGDAHTGIAISDYTETLAGYCSVFTQGVAYTKANHRILIFSSFW